MHGACGIGLGVVQWRDQRQEAVGVGKARQALCLDFLWRQVRGVSLDGVQQRRAGLLRQRPKAVAQRLCAPVQSAQMHEWKNEVGALDHMGAFNRSCGLQRFRKSGLGRGFFALAAIELLIGLSRRGHREGAFNKELPRFLRATE